MRQHGVIARDQLVSLGLGRGAIARRVATHRLHRVHRGVYAVGHSHLDARGRLMAAVLACGAGALASHRSGAWLWGFWGGASSRPDVTAAGRNRTGGADIVLHQPRSLHLDDRAVREGIPVTTVARTLLDLAEVVTLRQLERAFEDAERLRLLDLRAIEALRGRSTGRHGLRALDRVMGDLEPSSPDARSELEHAFVQLCRDAGLPLPAMNVSVAGFEVDALWPMERLVVELDGYAFHRSRTAFESDRARDAHLQLAGHRVIRLTYRRLVDDPDGVAGLLRSLLVGMTSPGGDTRRSGVPVIASQAE